MLAFKSRLATRVGEMWRDWFHNFEFGLVGNRFPVVCGLFSIAFLPLLRLHTDFPQCAYARGVVGRHRQYE